MVATMEIPERSLFKAPEVCAIAKVQPYVLRSWEAEFPGLGKSTSAGDARVYRRTDVELALKIKQLLFEEGLTLGAARRKLEGELDATTEQSDPSIDELLGRNARERITEVRRGLRGILDLLSGNGDGVPRGFDPVPAPPSTGRKASRAKSARKRRRATTAKRKR